SAYSPPNHPGNPPPPHTPKRHPPPTPPPTQTTPVTTFSSHTPLPRRHRPSQQLGTLPHLSTPLELLLAHRQRQEPLEMPPPASSATLPRPPQQPVTRTQRLVTSDQPAKPRMAAHNCRPSKRYSKPSAS